MNRGAGSSALDDAGLAVAAGEGDASAFEEIVRRHGGLVLGLATRLLGSRADAEDVAQEVFLRVHRGLPSFRGDASLRTWITQVTVNAARNHHRWSRRRRLHLTRSLDEPAAEDAPAPREKLADASAGPERLALSAEAGHRVEEALARLPEEYRDAIVLRESGGLSYEEIAARLGVRIGTVKSRIARARARLQEALRDLVGSREEVSP